MKLSLPLDDHLVVLISVSLSCLERHIERSKSIRLSYEKRNCIMCRPKLIMVPDHPEIENSHSLKVETIGLATTGYIQTR